MANPRTRSTRAAERTTRELKRLFDKLGSRDHPRGAVLAAYRTAHKALRDIARRYPNGGPIAAMETREVLDGLQRDVRGTAYDTLQQAATLGAAQGEVEAAAWGLRAARGRVDIAPAVNAVAGAVEAQGRSAVAEVVTTGDWGKVLGGDDRAGLLWPASVIQDGAKWATTAAVMALLAQIGPAIQAAEQDTERPWGKQTVPAIDERTTDCCLQAAGQVVRFDSTFKLTGTPRYADRMDWTPFHDYCRTSIVMVPLDLADDDVTAKIMQQREQEQKLRDEAAARILEIVTRLAKLDTIPNARRLIDDTKEIKALRKELLQLRQRGKYPES